MARVMKDSGIEWIGDIATDFQVKHLKYLADILDEYRKPITADMRNQNAEILYDYYGASGVIDKIDGYTIDDHVMLIGEDGANLRMRNLPLMYEVNGKAWINNHAHILKPKEDVDFYYLFYALEGLDINPYITGSAQPKLNQENLKNIWIPIPCLSKQIKIAHCIKNDCAEIDAIIKKTNESIEEYRSYRKTIVIKAVTKGLYSDVKMKKTDSDWIGEIPAHWDYVRIQRLFETVDERNEDENALLLSLYTALGVKPRNELEEKGNKASTVINYKKVQKNDVIVNKLLAWMGAIGYSDYEGVTSPDYDVYRARKGANVVRNYYNEYFRNTCFNGDCYKYGHGIMLMRWRTYPEEFLRIRVPNPPLTEQQEIADYLAEKCGEIDALIAKKEAFVEEMEAYKKSLIYEYVTGKKEVV